MVTILPLCCHQDLEELDPDFIMAKQVEQLEKEKKELQERLKNQEKKVKERVDFFLKGFVLFWVLFLNFFLSFNKSSLNCLLNDPPA